MLEVTDRAVFLLKVAATSADAPPNAGIRIKRDPNSVAHGISIAFAIAEAPEDGDAELECDGLRIFVEDALVGALEDKTLDVREDGKESLLIFH